MKVTCIKCSGRGGYTAIKYGKPLEIVKCKYCRGEGRVLIHSKEKVV